MRSIRFVFLLLLLSGAVACTSDGPSVTAGPTATVDEVAVDVTEASGGTESSNATATSTTSPSDVPPTDAPAAPTTEVLDVDEGVVEGCEQDCPGGDDGQTATTLVDDVYCPEEGCPGKPGFPSFDYDGRRTWTVIAVERNDVLNVRSEPNARAELIGSLQPWQSGMHVGTEAVSVGRAEWRQVRLADGTEGWANARYLVATGSVPSRMVGTEERYLQELGEEVLAFLRGDADAPEPAEILSPEGLWIGGLLVYGDGDNGFNWIAADDLNKRADWAAERRIELPAEWQCGIDCDRSVFDALGTSVLGADATVSVLEGHESEPGGALPTEAAGFLAGEIGVSWPRGVPIIQIDQQPPDDNNIHLWTTLYVIPDSSSGGVAAIYHWGWTP